MNICDTEKFKYNRGYLYLPIELDSDSLPNKITIDGTPLVIKDSFHVSLMCIKDIEENSRLDNIADNIIQLFCDYITEHDIGFEGFTGEFRFAKRDKDGRRSLVGMCKITNLDNFFDKVNKDLQTNIPYQPTHVSLYTLQPNEAIGLNSPENIENMTINVSDTLPQEFIDRLVK